MFLHLLFFSTANLTIVQFDYLPPLVVIRRIQSARPHFKPLFDLFLEGLCVGQIE